ncbi:uncharacterized protein H6S33_002315 [Morchella sextelata]|uniref:uncharacterized protein n=1 Tax=Morchella sextelata TaxID=1174677 RepID=UPI001D03EDBD|nr:uncharacterized protein H6S33_002315 [Morchella sextelata]KAH0608263.1 hypothetical protein H6S33_002315 [Morchella sextelata]
MATNGDKAPPMTRAKEVIHGDEEAGAELKLGEFQNVSSLTLSETKEVLTAVFNHRREQGKFKVPDNDVVTKTQAYLEVFSRFKQRESVQAVERILAQQTDLVAFEKSQLGTLCCDSAEEAKTLIPSLQDKISDEDLQELLNEITKLRQFV